MKNLILLLIVFTLSNAYVFSQNSANSNKPDSVYLFAYASESNSGRSGLLFAWSLDRQVWHEVGDYLGSLRSDYGRWGVQKRMIAPFLYKSPDGTFKCVWSLNDKDDALAVASSKDLVYWGRQYYPVTGNGKNCLSPVISYDKGKNAYKLSWKSTDKNGSAYSCFYTKNFDEYSPVQTVRREDLQKRDTIDLSGKREVGTLNKVPWRILEGLLAAHKEAESENALDAEWSGAYNQMFPSLKPLHAKITADDLNNKKIGNTLLGVFFEDINYAADGGLYAELLQNRDFEYDPGDKEYRDPKWNHLTAWSLEGSGTILDLDSVLPLTENNRHYASLFVKNPGAGLVNTGYDGIPLKARDPYDFLIFTRITSGSKGSFIVQLRGKDGNVFAKGKVENIGNQWKKYVLSMIPTADVSDANLEIIPETEGKYDIDMVSLFPRKTFKNRKNGMRADLAQTIADIHPKFVRFPGGCVSHGDGIANIYRWKNTIGPLQDRKPQRNLWGYHQSMGLGYYEYFQFCEDIGAEPLPVVAAGVPCQNSATGGAGQQGGIPMKDMDAYVQDILDLIEWANGDAKTTKWGKIRAQEGHPKPFNLKYLGVGNEDLISDIFEKRFSMIYEAVKKKYPAVTVIGTAGPANYGTDYTEGWNLVTKLGVPMVDEHYYQSPGWFVNHQDFYDQYDRSKAKVYLGEYAAHLPGRPSNIETALSEALYLTALERNGDVVKMASYAPLLGRKGHTQWTPDLIYFDRSEVKPTVDYYVQKLFGNNSGDEYVFSNMSLSGTNDKLRKRIAVSIVKDTQKGELIIKLVNLLPVEVSADLDLKNFKFDENGRAIKYLLSGAPDEDNAIPVQTETKISNQIQETLPAFSFTLLRAKLAVKK